MQVQYGRLLSSLALAAATACGGAAEPTDEGTSSGESGSATTSTSSTQGSTGPSTASTSGSGEGSEGASGETGPGTSGGTSLGTTGPDATGTSGLDTTGTSGLDTTGGDVGTTYEAVYIAGGLDRVRVTRRDPEADRCAWLMLVWPGGAEPGDVVVPEQWGVESIVLSDRGDDCIDPLGPQGELAQPETASGAIAFPSASGVLPCTLSIDVELTFSAPPAWVPSAVELSAEDLVVLGTPGCP